jgi:redox-sensitive bicupin YhaK (pirin superfamily)
MVGDGFEVRTLFSYEAMAQEWSPFLLLDRGGPMALSPADQRRGVGEHPHRGFETVTIIYEGVIEHRDSAGNSGVIGPGDVQWMTAGSGVVHEEMHEREFARRGGTLDIVQLWVNLPRTDKMTPPRYQTLTRAQIPVVALPDGGQLRVIAGEAMGARGPARTFTPITVCDATLPAGTEIELQAIPGHTALVVLLGGAAEVNGARLRPAEFALLARDGDRITIAAGEESAVLFLSGEPIPEPVYGYGPFVMNEEEEIATAIRDYRSGKMGHLAPASA